MFLIYQSSQSSSYRTDTHYYAQLEVLAFSNYHLHSSVFISGFALVPRYEAQAGPHTNQVSSLPEFLSLPILSFVFHLEKRVRPVAQSLLEVTLWSSQAFNTRFSCLTSQVARVIGLHQQPWLLSPAHLIKVFYFQRSQLINLIAIRFIHFLLYLVYNFFSPEHKLWAIHVSLHSKPYLDIVFK